MRIAKLILLLIIGLISCTKPDKFKPTKEHTIYDSAKLLTKIQIDSVFELIENLERNIGSQIVVITIDTLNGRNLETYSLNQAQKLKIGRANFADGILLTVAVKNREMRIEVGSGLELIIEDDIASRINRQVIAPRFRKGQYGQGIYKGLDSIKYLIENNKNLVGKRH